MTGLSIAFGIVLPAVLSYVFVGSLVYRVLKKMGIGFERFSFYNDDTYATLLSIFWPVAMPPLIIFKAMHKASKSVFELIESRMEDEGEE